MRPSRLYPSGFRLFRRSRRFSSIKTSTLSMSSGSCCVSSRNFRNSGRNEDTRFFHFTFLSNLMWPLRAVLADFDVRAAKTGMLFSAEIVRTVSRELRGTSLPLVVDPVMVATVGARLEQDDFGEALVDHLLARAALVTPNRFEAERLSGIRIAKVESMETAARAILRLGPRAVLIKGGHTKGPLVDVFYDGRRMRRLRGQRYPKTLHGAGCTLAASIAAYLALGRPLLGAVESARLKGALGFRQSYRAGQGGEIINSHAVPD